MTDTKFTSGPWVKCSRGESLVGSNGKNISVYNCGLSATVKSSETVANAHLIASAPAMYEMLKTNLRELKFRLEHCALNECERWDVPNHIKEIESILSTARGE